MAAFFARLERFERVGSTNDIVRAWLDAGTPEVCLAVADEQTAGRGRAGRTWIAPRGAALLLSLGFRPTWLLPDRAWRIVATASLAMAAAAEEVAGLSGGAVLLKWPNDLVIETAAGPRKLAGVLGESQGLGSEDPRLIVGLGVNADWRVSDFPPDLAGAMTSLRDVAGDRPIALARLRHAFLDRLVVGIGSLRAGRFDEAGWTGRQLTTGRVVRLEGADREETVRAIGVNVKTGALVVEDAAASSGERQVLVGEIGHVRLADAAAPVRV